MEVLFARGPWVPVAHMIFFKTPVEAFNNDSRLKDGQSAKEWEYINNAGVWVETGLAALELAKEMEGQAEDLARRLSLTETSFKAGLEMLSMRAQFFSAIMENGMGEANQMAYSVGQGHDAVKLKLYCVTRESLTAKLDVKAAKQLESTDWLSLERIKAEREAPPRMNNFSNGCSCTGIRGSSIMAQGVDACRQL